MPSTVRANSLIPATSRVASSAPPPAPPPMASFLRRVGEFALEPPAVLDQRLDARHDLGLRRLEQRREVRHAGVLLFEMEPRGLARQRLDAAHARRHAALGHDGDRPDLAGAPRHACRRRARPRTPCWTPCAARPIETTRTSSPYFSPNSARAPDSIASATGMTRVTTGSFCQTTAFATRSTSVSSASRDRLRVAEVEPQPVGRDERALLGDVVAERQPQRLVQQMGRRMVAADRAAARVVDGERQRVADRHRALAHLDRHARTDRRASSGCPSPRARRREPS